MSKHHASHFYQITIVRDWIQWSIVTTAVLILRVTQEESSDTTQPPHIYHMTIYNLS